jgi:hypothetical protein
MDKVTLDRGCTQTLRAAAPQTAFLPNQIKCLDFYGQVYSIIYEFRYWRHALVEHEQYRCSLRTLSCSCRCHDLLQCRHGLDLIVIHYLLVIHYLTHVGLSNVSFTLVMDLVCLPCNTQLMLV